MRALQKLDISLADGFSGIGNNYLGFSSVCDNIMAHLSRLCTGHTPEQRLLLQQHTTSIGYKLRSTKLGLVLECRSKNYEYTSEIKSLNKILLL